MSPLECEAGRAFDRAADQSDDAAMTLALYLAAAQPTDLDAEATALLDAFRDARKRREEAWQAYVATWLYPAMLTGRPVAAEAVTDSDETETDARD